MQVSITGTYCYTCPDYTGESHSETTSANSTSLLRYESVTSNVQASGASLTLGRQLSFGSRNACQRHKPSYN